ncbi:MAG: pyruvate kinase [Lachnospiraceae bacterium]|nr:pyruvate kinase [Lachnospiraceae bacterium]
MKTNRKTKIICTLGPSTDQEEVLKQLMLEGMDVARFNFSHGDHAEQGRRLEQVCRMRASLGLPVATLLDTKGPEIRLGQLKDGKAVLKEGQTFTLTTEELLGDETKASITYPGLVKDVSPGVTILIDDGLIEMTVQQVTEQEIVCIVKNGGTISNKKGVNVPNVELSMPYISQKDYEDIVFGIEHDFDFIAASFVRSADDVLQIRRIFEEKDCHSINIISKIENMQGVDNIDEIIRVSDGIMVARGDMGVEIPLEEVPVIQKMIIEKVYNAGKQVITATQMLDSMMKNPRPTRAEATDVANAIYDGTSAIMLSGETAAGLYPVEAVMTMVKIAARAEQDIDYRAKFKRRESMSNPDITNAISHATCTTAEDLNASAIITVSHSGRTARMVSKYRPSCPVIGCTMSEKVCRQLNLSWGVTPLVLKRMENADELFEHAVDEAEKAGLIEMGDITVITAGIPLGVSGTTNMVKVHVAGHILITGDGIVPRKASGNLCVCEDAQELRRNFKDGDIIVTKETNNEMIEQIRASSGIIVEAEGANTHAAIVGLSLDLPVLAGAQNATKILKTGAYVNLDGKRGVVSCNQ